MSDAEALILSCIDCGNPFEFSAHAQTLHKERGFNTPRRCPKCRGKAKAARESEEKKKNKKQIKTYHKATCGRCGLEFSISFKPRAHRPVFCRSCYLQQPNR